MASTWWRRWMREMARRTQQRQHLAGKRRSAQGPGIEFLEDRTVPTVATAPTSFAAAVPYTVGTEPHSVAAGDLDGDKDLDLAVANNDGGVSVLLNNGNGTFQAAIPYASGGHYSSVALGDFDGDGTLDIVAANRLPGTVKVLLNNGDGTFQDAVPYDTGTSITAVSVGDLDGDGHLDITTVNGVDEVSVLLNAGDGTFGAAASYTAGPNSSSVTVGDFNGDGKADLATANEYNHTASVLINNGDGTFQTEASYSVGDTPFGITTADLDGDGNLDLVTANLGDTNVSVLHGNGDGTFEDAVSFAAGSSPSSVVTAVVNGDGTLDIVVANDTDTDATVSVLRGIGDGTFENPDPYDVGNQPLSLTVADLDGDARPDIVAANAGSDNVSVLLNNLERDSSLDLISSDSSITAGQDITLTATVSPKQGDGGIPTGDVIFTVDGADQQPVTLDSEGKAQLVLTPTLAGTHTVTAAYQGQGFFTASDNNDSPLDFTVTSA